MWHRNQVPQGQRAAWASLCELICLAWWPLPAVPPSFDATQVYCSLCLPIRAMCDGHSLNALPKTETRSATHSTVLTLSLPALGPAAVTCCKSGLKRVIIQLCQQFSHASTCNGVHRPHADALAFSTCIRLAEMLHGKQEVELRLFGETNE